jgi:hypothetical protein
MAGDPEDPRNASADRMSRTERMRMYLFIAFSFLLFCFLLGDGVLTEVCSRLQDYWWVTAGSLEDSEERKC